MIMEEKAELAEGGFSKTVDDRTLGFGELGVVG
jgi:hypothetical protein